MEVLNFSVLNFMSLLLILFYYRSMAGDITRFTLHCYLMVLIFFPAVLIVYFERKYLNVSVLVSQKLPERWINPQFQRTMN